MTNPTSPEGVFNALRTLVHQLDPFPQTYPSDPDRPNRLIDAVEVTFTCLTHAVAFSLRVPGHDDRIQDFILMQHDLQYFPIASTRTGFDSFRFQVRALTDEAAKTSGLQQGAKIPPDDSWAFVTKENTNGVSAELES
jgi:hypothetical protein